MKLRHRRRTTARNNVPTQERRRWLDRRYYSGLRWSTRERKALAARQPLPMVFNSIILTRTSTLDSDQTGAIVAANHSESPDATAAQEYGRYKTGCRPTQDT